MAAWFASGRIVDAILVLVAAEAALLLVLRRLTGHGPPPLPLLCNLASGAALMLAVRAALVGADWTVVAACLLAALLAHLGDLGPRLLVRSHPSFGRSRDAAVTGTAPCPPAFNGRSAR